MSAVRNFWLTNADDQRFELKGSNIANTISFLHEPEGLGYSVALNTVKIGNTDLILSEQYNLPPVAGDLIFLGSVPAAYQQYQSLLQFLARRPITLHYLPPNVTEGYRCLVRVTSLEKTEVSYEDGCLHCPIQFYRQGMWYNDNPNVLDVANEITEGKSYPLDRPYSYGAVSLENIQLVNNGMTDTSIKIEIFGETTDPEWSLFDAEAVQYGAAKILGTYTYVRVDSADTGEEIHLERNGSVIANAINMQDLTVGSPQQVYVTFLKLQPGTSTLRFDLGDSFDGSVRLTWSNAYVSV